MLASCPAGTVNQIDLDSGIPIPSKRGMLYSASSSGKARLQKGFDRIDVEQGSVGVEDDSGERGCGAHKRSLCAFAWQRQLLSARRAR